MCVCVCVCAWVCVSSSAPSAPQAHTEHPSLTTQHSKYQQRPLWLKCHSFLRFSCSSRASQEKITNHPPFWSVTADGSLHDVASNCYLAAGHREPVIELWQPRPTCAGPVTERPSSQRKRLASPRLVSGAPPWLLPPGPDAVLDLSPERASSKTTADDYQQPCSPANTLCHWQQRGKEASIKDPLCLAPRRERLHMQSNNRMRERERESMTHSTEYFNHGCLAGRSLDQLKSVLGGLHKWVSRSVTRLTEFIRRRNFQTVTTWHDVGSAWWILHSPLV